MTIRPGPRPESPGKRSRGNAENCAPAAGPAAASRVLRAGLSIACLLFQIAPPRALGSVPAWSRLDPLYRARHGAAIPVRVPSARGAPAGAAGGTLGSAGAVGGTARFAGAASPLAALPADSLVSGIASFHGDPSALGALGLSVGTRVGDLFTVRGPRAAVERLLADARLSGFEVSRRLAPTLHQSGITIGSPGVHRARPALPGGLQGQGVLLGFVDTGIDLGHPDFWDSSGHSRLVALWDQYGEGPPPSGFGYGTGWSEGDLRQGVAREQDDVGHGTHVAGIAGGNGRATGRGVPPFYEVGVAPQAELAMVKTTFFADFATQNVSLVDGVKYLFQSAAARGEDAVVNVSLGAQWGGHDGTSLTERMLSGLTGPGRILVFSAGNDAERGLHTRMTCPSAASSAEAHWIVHPYLPLNGPENDAMTLEAWGTPGARPAVSVISPQGTVYGPVPAGEEQTFPGPEGDVSIFNGSNPSDLLDRDTTLAVTASWFLISVLDLTSQDDIPASGRWTVRVEDPGMPARYDLWIDSNEYTDIAPMPDFAAEADPSRTLTVPGACDSCLTVGSFVTMTEWQDSAGEASGYRALGEAAPEVGDLSFFSSRGPRRDGLARPDLAAPGQGVASSLSSAVPGVNPLRVFRDGVHGVFEGTSLAAPQVAGAVALLLQLQPHLPPARVREILRRVARRDGFAAGAPDSGWGAGKLDLTHLVEAVATTDFGPSLTRRLSLRHRENPARSSLVTFEVRAQAAAPGARLEVYTPDGRRVSSLDTGPLPAGTSLLRWPHDPELASGVYFARLAAGPQVAFDKLVLVK